jgi:hypothetical protein
MSTIRAHFLNSRILASHPASNASHPVEDPEVIGELVDLSSMESGRAAASTESHFHPPSHAVILRPREESLPNRRRWIFIHLCGECMGASPRHFLQMNVPPRPLVVDSSEILRLRSKATSAQDDIRWSRDEKISDINPTHVDSLSVKGPPHQCQPNHAYS